MSPFVCFVSVSLTYRFRNVQLEESQDDRLVAGGGTTLKSSTLTLLSRDINLVDQHHESLVNPPPIISFSVDVSMCFRLGGQARKHEVDDDLAGNMAMPTKIRKLSAFVPVIHNPQLVVNRQSGYRQRNS